MRADDMAEAVRIACTPESCSTMFEARGEGALGIVGAEINTEYRPS
jgi:hypothetical protein